MNFETEQKLDKLSQQIAERAYENANHENSEWQEYDVMVVMRANEDAQRWARLPARTIEYHHSEPRRRLIATRYADDIIWLFKELSTIHPEEIERYSWHDFYAILADAANLYIEEHKGSTTANRLLESIVNNARQIYR